MEIQGVSVGDKFTKRKDLNKRIYTVIDIYEVRSLMSEKHIKYICVAEYEFMGQLIKFEVPFPTVVLNKVKD